MLLFAAVLLPPSLLRAQSDPTPFWLPASPDAPAESPPKKKAPARKRAHSAPKTAASDEPSPEESAPAPPPKRAEKKHKRPPQRAQPGPPAPEEEPELAAPAPTAPAEKRHHYEPLPPIPRIEPELPAAHPAPSRAPIFPPGSTPAPAQPSYPPVYQPPMPSYSSPSGPANPSNQPTYQPYQPAYPSNQPVQPAPLRPSPFGAPAPAGPAGRGQPALLPVDEQRGTGDEPDESGIAAPRLRRFSLELIGGVWGKAVSDGQSTSWQIAYGADFGIALWRWLQIDVRALRAGGQDGNAYVNATASHLLFDARLFAVLGLGPAALFAGGGGGAAFEQTQLFLQDVGGTPTTLSSSGLEALATFAAGARLRPWRGLTLRLEVDGVIREGNLEPVFLLGAGWAF